MKKNNLFGILFAVIAFFACYQNGSATTAYCYPDCPDDEWNLLMPTETEFTIGSCRYVADYYLRFACGQYCDIMLWRVRSIDPPPCGQNFTPKQLLDIATAQVIMELTSYGNTKFKDITGYSPVVPNNPGDCVDYWRASKAPCWSYFVSNSFNPERPPSHINWYGGISYCDYDECCRTIYKVCMNDYGQLVVTESHSDYMGICKDPSCYLICD